MMSTDLPTTVISSNDRIDAIFERVGVTDVDAYLDTVGVDTKIPGPFDVYFRTNVAALLGRFRKD